jgi:A/G-specific adenine glycosylase
VKTQHRQATHRNPERAHSGRVADEKGIRVFQRRLLRWYARHGRDLPWRHTRDPYRILVSEIMLHQTQVSRVIPKYYEWLAAYPTFPSLAAAPLDEVRRLWRPLGYNFRPERLHRIARLVVNEHNGNLPDTFDQLVALPGIGRYTAGAILSFAFHQDTPIVDTNVRRLIQRAFGIRGNPRQAAVNRTVWQRAEALIPTGKAFIFNQALIDLGALICTARKPACPVCFFEDLCEERHRARASETS